MVSGLLTAEGRAGGPAGAPVLPLVAAARREPDSGGSMVSTPLPAEEVTGVLASTAPVPLPSSAARREPDSVGPMVCRAS
eukprot:4688735-Pyramimonas_sp.AAC.1